MLSTAIVIFREALEIAVILGAVLAATRGLQNRIFWVLAGLGGGIFGALLVAVFARSISDAVSGMGQEIFNAGILFIAALFIGWTVLWMRKHSREMTAHLRQVGHEVARGKMPFYSLSFIIGLAILREGSEIVLFIYSMALSGQTTASIIMGSIIGFTLGTFAGVLLYYGLIKISAKYMFKVTSWLLILLVAGLASQGAAYLLAAGYFSGLSAQMWDTSWLLSEGSIAGKALHSLIGYSARPSLVQIIFYIGTLGGLVATITLMDKKGKKPAIVALAIGISLSICSPAFALDEIYSPRITKGELEIEYNGSRTFDSDHDKNNLQSHELEFQYSPTNYWATAITGAFAREADGNFRMDATSWENQFEFTNPGEYWLDTGLRVSYGFAHGKDNADGLEVKFLMEKDIGKFINLANIGFDQELWHYAHAGPDFTVLASSRYKYDMMLQPGIELQSDLGTTQDRRRFQDQEYYIGPVIYGQLPSISANNLKYELAYLFGVTDAAANSAARILLEYEFHL